MAVKTFDIQVQSLNYRDSYLIDACGIISAIGEAVASFNRTYPEIASSVQCEQTVVEQKRRVVLPEHRVSE